MKYAHDLMAYEAGESILTGLRGGNAAWAGGRLTQQTNYWPGIMDWPVPDKMFEDTTPSTIYSMHGSRRCRV